MGGLSFFFVDFSAGLHSCLIFEILISFLRSGFSDFSLWCPLLSWFRRSRLSKSLIAGGSNFDFCHCLMVGGSKIIDCGSPSPWMQAGPIFILSYLVLRPKFHLYLFYLSSVFSRRVLDNWLRLSKSLFAGGSNFHFIILRCPNFMWLVFERLFVSLLQFLFGWA